MCNTLLALFSVFLQSLPCNLLFRHTETHTTVFSLPLHSGMEMKSPKSVGMVKFTQTATSASVTHTFCHPPIVHQLSHLSFEIQLLTILPAYSGPFSCSPKLVFVAWLSVAMRAIQMLWAHLRYHPNHTGVFSEHCNFSLIACDGLGQISNNDWHVFGPPVNCFSLMWINGSYWFIILMRPWKVWDIHLNQPAAGRTHICPTNSW